jgi:hypothetical protein
VIPSEAAVTPAGWVDEWLTFPPGRRFIVLPAAPRRAALEGLALYDAVALRQEIALRAGRFLITAGVGRLMRARRYVPLPDHSWWTSWLDKVVVPRVGPVAGAAFRLLGSGSSEPDRFTCLLLAADGAPLAFGKAWQSADNRSVSETVSRALAACTSGRPVTFAVPAVIDAGMHRDRSYLLQTPLPPGGHRRMKPDHRRLRRVIAEYQDLLHPALGDPPRSDLVPIHGSLTPLNLREDCQGGLWLLDWDKLRWGPPLYDELRYWISDLARRHSASGVRGGERILLRMPGVTTVAVRRALEFRVEVRGAEILRREQELRDALFLALDRR